MRKNVLSKAASWLALIAAVTVGFRQVLAHALDLFEAWPLFAGLALPAALAAYIADGEARYRPVRLGAAFLGASLLCLPPPAATLLAAVSLAAGRGGGLIGPHGRGLRRAGPVLLALALLESPARALAEVIVIPFGVPAALLFLLLGVQAVTFAAARLLDGPEPAGLRWRRVPATLRVTLLETVNLPLAYLLVVLAERGPGPAFAALAVILMLAGFALRRLEHALADLTETNRSLAARVTELATLHAIGREIVSSLDPSRVFAIVERECRKILDVDALSIALADPDTSRLTRVYRRRRAEPADEEPLPVVQGLASWVIAERRPVRIDDLREHPPRLPRPKDLAEEGVRSVLAVPLVVEDRSVGVVVLQSRRARVYDEHHLSLLTTVAQQAAVAIENARHYEMATIDSLTGMYLRDYFFRRLEEEYRRVDRYGGNFAVLMIDLDGFKAINDSQGHLAGDRYLQAAGAAIRRRLRGADLGCRYGGDEFCLLLPETRLEGARAIAERLREAIAELEVMVDDHRLRTTVSIGLATFRDHNPGDLRGLLQKADEALYRAKRTGRDRVVAQGRYPNPVTRRTKLPAPRPVSDSA